MIQFIVPALTGLAGRMVGKSGAEAEAVEKIDLIKQLAGLTPEQARAVDALKGKSVEEVRMRLELGVGPYAPLPENASARAQEIRQRRIASATAAVAISPAEQAAAATSPSAMDAILEKKAAEVVANLR